MTEPGTQYVTIDRLGEHVGRTVCVRGWVVHVRSSGKVAFIVVRDGSGICQAVVEKSDETAELFEAFRRVGQESSIEVSGTVRADERAPGGYEIAVTEGAIVGESVDYPITPKPHGVDFLMKRRHLWLRSSRQATIMRIRDTLIWAIREFFRSRDFVLVDTPIFSPSAGEGASTLFKVEYFDDEVYLAQTGQLYLEAAALALGKVYCFGPTFRAEKSKTRRHLTEFWMVEPELTFVDLGDLLDLAEDFVCTIVGKVLDRHRADLESLGRDCSVLKKIQKPFVRMTYDQVLETLHSPKVDKLLDAERQRIEAQIAEARAEVDDLERRNAGSIKAWKKARNTARIIELREQLSEWIEQLGHIPEHLKLAKGFTWGQDLGGSDETIISKLHDRPVFVTHYPRGAKAFYMRQARDRDEVVENFDMLAPGGYGEVIGGSMREDQLDRLAERMEQEGLPREAYEWYLDLRRYGSVPHGGFGLGVERTLAWLCGLKHIRETIAYPRLMGRLYP